MKKIKGFAVKALFMMVIVCSFYGSGVEMEANEVDGDYQYYLEKDGTVTVMRYSGDAKTVTIPATIEGKVVACISYSTFYGNKTVESITLPNGVVGIEGSAFYGCSKLKEIYLPDTLKYIEANAFYSCTSLERISLPKSLSNIANYSYNTRAERSIFENCTALKQIDVDQENAYFESVDGVLFDEKMENLLSYPAGAPETSYTVPESVTCIAPSAFYSCFNLTEINLPDKLKDIEGDAFYGCANLKSIRLPQQLKNIGTCFAPDNSWQASNVFKNCTSLNKISVDKGNKYFATKGGVLYNKKMTTLFICPEGLKGKYEIAKGVTMISTEAFYKSKLTSIIISAGVKTISSGAFYECKKLSSITLPKGIKIISRKAFSGCSNLKKVTLPDTLKKIDQKVFAGCKKLTSITLPKSLETIGGYGMRNVFVGCASLGKINVKKGNKNFTSIDGVLFSKNKTKIYVCPAGRKGKYLIPKSVKYIGDKAFYGCKYLTAITIPKGVKKIERAAFYGCGIKSLSIPEGVTEIGQGVFNNCTKMKTLILPKSLGMSDMVASSNTFYNCYSLEEINVRKGNKYFYSKDGVLYLKKEVNKYIGTELLCYPAAKKANMVTVKKGITIGKYAFSSCHNIKEVVINNDGTRLYGVFQDCKDMKVIIPNSYTAFGYDWETPNATEFDPFSGCENVTICAKKDSTAYKYAMFYGIPFEELK